MKTAKILCVDDDEVIVNLVAKALSAEGFDVVTCTNGRDAVRQAVRTEPDLIISDIAMPSMDGYGVLRAVKDNPITAHIPVVFLTAMRESTEKASAFRSGVVEFITKPFTTSALVLKVRRILVGLPLRDGRIEGTVDTSQFEAILDTLQEGLRTGVLSVRADEDEGMVILKNGDVLDARFADLSGDEAMTRLLQCTHGSFTFQEADGTTDLLYDDAAAAAGEAAANRRPEPSAPVEDPEDAPPPAETEAPGEEGDAPHGLAGPAPIDPRTADRLESAGRRVLVIDDDSALLKMLAAIFRKEGFDVDTASNGLEGIEQARRRPPDVIVTDLMMPHLDGFRLCELVREDPTLTDIPLLMLSVKDSREEWRRAIQSGADDYLQKTTSLSDLVFRVRLLIKRHSEMRKRRADGDKAVIRGEIRHIGVPEVMAILEVNLKTGRIGVNRADQRAHIYLRDGMVIHAEFEGSAALHGATYRDIVAHISTWESGSYEFVPDVLPPS